MERSTIRDIEFRNDLNTLVSLQKKFNSALGYDVTSDDLLHRSYNPVTDRWHIEHIGEENSNDFKNELIENIYTNLKERYHVSNSDGTYLIRNEKLYSEFFPEQPFSQVILRGANYRTLHGSREQEREGIRGELGGFIKIQELLTDTETPLGTTIISLSPPGEITDTAYTGKFIDIFTLTQKDNQKIIHRNRIAVNYSKEMYLKKALELEPEFIDGYDGRPMDAWFLSHPIVISRELPLFDWNNGTTETEFFRRMQTKTNGIPLHNFIEYYLTKIYENPIDWKQVAVAFNAILNRADELMETADPQVVIYQNKQSFYEQVQLLGVQDVKIVGGGGCPSNKGFSIFGSDFKFLDIKEYFHNSVSQFSDDETWEYHSGKCIVCEKDPTDVGPCNICKQCEKKF